MKDDTVVALRQPESFSDDPLTEILRAGARQLLGQAIEAEVAAHIEAHADLTDASGRRRIVRPTAAQGPERTKFGPISLAPSVGDAASRARDLDPQPTGWQHPSFMSMASCRLKSQSRQVASRRPLPWLYPRSGRMAHHRQAFRSPWPTSRCWDLDAPRADGRAEPLAVENIWQSHATTY